VKQRREMCQTGEGGVEGVKLMRFNSVSHYRNKLISSQVTQRHAHLQLNRVSNTYTVLITSCNARDKIKIILSTAQTEQFCNLYVYQNKRRLFPYAKLSDGSQNRDSG
jgi:hypothetical protein